MKKIIICTILSILFETLLLAGPGDTCRMKIGMNLSAISLFDNQQSFVDVMKTTRAWMVQDQNGIITAQDNATLFPSFNLDADGYAMVLPITHTSQVQPQTLATIMCGNVGGKYPAGTYTVLYNGTGTFTFSLDASVTSSVPGQITLSVTPSNNGIFMKILTSISGNPIRNIRVLMPGSFATYLSQPFNPIFLAKLAPFNTIRFMEWDNMNTNTEVQWANRRLPSYYTQSSTAFATKGIAHEYMFKLCNQLQANCWISTPTMADSNYIASLATLMRDSLNNNLKIYLEYSNECWNQPLSPANYNWIDSPTNSPAGLNHYQKTAYHIKKVFDTWKAVFGNQMSSRVIRVCAGWGSNQGKVQMDTMMHYLINNGSKPDAMSIGGYNLWLATDYSLLTVNCPTVTLNQVRNVDSLRWLGTIAVHTLFEQTAASYTIPLTYYEGGTHIIGTSTGCASTAVMTYTSSAHMYNHYDRILKTLRDTTTAVLFNAFIFTGTGLMGTLPNINDVTSTKYNALLDNIYNCPTVASINESSKIYNRVNIYPNPSGGSFKIDIPGNTIGKVNIEIYNTLGQKIFSEEKMQSENKSVISVSDLNLQDGAYYLKISCKENNFNSKIIIYR